MNKRYELTEDQVRTLVQHAFDSGARSVRTAEHLDDELECVLAALEPVPEQQQPQGCGIVQGRAHDWAPVSFRGVTRWECVTCGARSEVRPYA